MAARDIMPFDSPDGGHHEVRAFFTNTTAAFLEGEPVAMEAAGTIVEAATQPDATAEPAGLLGIAAAGAARTASTFYNDLAAPWPARMRVPVYMVSHGSGTFITRNLHSGADAFVVPTGAHVGDKGSLRLTAGGTWGFDIGGTAHFEIVRVLDAGMDDCLPADTDGVFVVFRRVEE